MSVDRLDALLKRFSVSARMFHSGALCGINDLAAQAGMGHLHVIRSGEVRAQQSGHATLEINAPTLLFYPRPLAHRLLTDNETGADMVCANVSLGSGANPIAQALPGVMAVPYGNSGTLGTTAELMFTEAFAQRCGRQAIVDRLFEVLLIQLLRRLLDEGSVTNGLLAGLAHAQLRRALVAMHEAPARAWTLEALAQTAGMSRSSFANHFRETLGMTPGEYLTHWRLHVAQDLLRRGLSVQRVATDVGYASPVAFARAFRAAHGLSPREWSTAA